MKRPSFQFYPSDWLRDTALRSCSTGARGLWIDMICFMHEGSPYGYLKVSDKVILPSNLARMVGETLEVVEGWLHELEEAGVYDVDNGAIYSRRMIRDEELRQKRAEGGKLGGNPNLKVNHEVKQEDKQKPTPSSSSSSTSSTSVIKEKKQRGSRLTQDFVLPNNWKDFCIQERPDLQPTKIFDQFKDYWIASPKGTKLDWFATWRNWVRNTNAPKANPADIVRITVPMSNKPDEALEKIKADEKKAAPIPLEVLAKMAELRKKA